MTAVTGSRPGRLRRAEHVMGTVVSFDVPAWADAVLGRAVRWLHWVDATFSPYREDSDVSRFGRGSLALAECAPELAEVLAACADVSARSGGYFTVRPGGRFDPSGYVKGWAIERAAAMLTAAGSAEHSVNGGGDIQCVGDHGPGQRGTDHGDAGQAGGRLAGVRVDDVRAALGGTGGRDGEVVPGNHQRERARP